MMNEDQIDLLNTKIRQEDNQLINEQTPLISKHFHDINIDNKSGTSE